MSKKLKGKSKNIFVTDVLEKFKISPKTLVTILGIITLTGGSYGGYTIYKDNQRTDFQEVEPVYMSRILDGDTFTIDTGEMIRLSEINAPESNECYGEESASQLEELLRGQKLRLVKDIQGSDNFRRLVRYVIVENPDPKGENVLVNKYMLEHGFAKYSANDNQLYQNVLVTAENKARSEQLGLWKNCPANNLNKFPLKM